ncbi:MAG: peptidoglycan-binding protein [Leptolyngbyaceae cyanobacterium T60_A2020_046]|nr:peptidoglycan-binding protein [Leptolyngbyaceae cyanobacterium T60_A2020_046]
MQSLSMKALICCLVGFASGGVMLPSAIATPDAPTHPIQVAQTAPRPTLRLGETGESVAELQGILALLGFYDGGIDGIFQTSTQDAVRAFQVEAGLDSDGIVGPATWNRLLPTPSTDFTPPEITASTPSRPEPEPDRAPATVDLPVLRPGMTGPAVTRLQERLNTLGFYQGAFDGIFGPQTEAAVKSFQQRNQLMSDGIVGPATWRALLR